MKPFTIFTALLLGTAIMALIMSLEMGSVARLVPLRVLIPTILLLALQLMLDLGAGKGKKSAWADLLGLVQSGSQNPGKASGPADAAAITWRKELGALIWVALLLALTLLLGFSAAAPVYVLLCYRFRAAQAWPLSLLMAGITVLVIQGLLVWLLELNLPGPLWA